MVSATETLINHPISTRYPRLIPYGSFAAVAALVLIAVGLSVARQFVQRVAPGYAGVLIDFSQGTTTGTPSVAELHTGQYLLINPITQLLAQYPISQQTLVMVRRKSESHPTAPGQVQGDDSVSCQDANGIPLHVDSRTLWRVNPEEVGLLYLLRPGVPLIGKDGGDIASQVVRPEVRNGLYLACSRFRYDEILGPRRVEFEAAASEIIGPRLKASHIVVDRFFLGAIFLEPDQQKAIQDKANAEQAALAASFLRQRAENEARAAVAKAEGDAESIRVLNEQITGSPEYIKYLYATKWDGKLPQTLMGGDDRLPVLAALQSGR